MNKQANLEILDVLTKAVQLYPDMHFTELLTQLHVNTNYSKEESADTLGKVFNSYLFDEMKNLPFTPISSKGVY